MRILLSAVFSALIGIAGVAQAQEPSQPPSEHRQADNPKVSVTGCLNKGSGAGAYTITDQRSGEKVPFSGPEKLDQYVNQTVTLTGTMTTDKSFKPETIKSVAASCEKQ